MITKIENQADQAINYMLEICEKNLREVMSKKEKALLQEITIKHEVVKGERCKANIHLNHNLICEYVDRTYNKCRLFNETIRCFPNGEIEKCEQCKEFTGGKNGLK